MEIFLQLRELNMKKVKLTRRLICFIFASGSYIFLSLSLCFIDDLVKCSVYVSNVTAMSNCIFLSLLLSMLRGLSNHPVPCSDSFQTKALNKTFQRMHSNPLVSWLRVCLFSNAENSFTRGENNYHPPLPLVALILSSRGGRPL